MSAWEVGEEKHWDEVQIGERVELFKEHGPVVAIHVPSLFCAHRFEDGTEKAMTPYVLVRVKRDKT